MKEDPLKVLREDTYSNEETNEMVGAMVRERYLIQHLDWSNFPTRDEVQVIEFKNGSKIELNGKTRKAYDCVSGDILFGFENMSRSEFIQLLINYSK